jgi:hypothetical protein
MGAPQTGVSVPGTKRLKADQKMPGIPRRIREAQFGRELTQASARETLTAATNPPLGSLRPEVQILSPRFVIHCKAMAYGEEFSERMKRAATILAEKQAGGLPQIHKSHEFVEAAKLTGAEPPRLAARV